MNRQLRRYSVCQALNLDESCFNRVAEHIGAILMKTYFQATSGSSDCNTSSLTSDRASVNFFRAAAFSMPIIAAGDWTSTRSEIFCSESETPSGSRTNTPADKRLSNVSFTDSDDMAPPNPATVFSIAVPRSAPCIGFWATQMAIAESSLGDGSRKIGLPVASINL